MGVGSKNPLLRYILIPLASYAENFKVLGPKLWEEFPHLCQKVPVKYRSIDRLKLIYERLKTRASFQKKQIVIGMICTRVVNMQASLVSLS